MVKRYKKYSELKIYEINRVLEGHIFAFGRVGSGKSVSLLSICQGYKDNHGYKIFDLYGGNRNEGLYWAFPSAPTKFHKQLRALGEPDESYPKQYYVNFLYPFFDSKLPKKLPKKTPFVKSTLFTIPVKSIEIDDIKMVLGNPSETIKGVWDDILDNLKNNQSLIGAGELAGKMKKTSNLLYTNFIKPLLKEGFISDKYNDYNLDLISEAKNKNVVSVLCLDFVPHKYHLFVINYILRNLKSLLESSKIPRKNIPFIREAATFFRATDDIVVEDRFRIFRSLLSHYIRMGRTGMHFILDCQSSAETRGLVQGSEDYLLMFRLTSWRDKADICDELKREKRMRADQVADLALLEKGEAYIAETGRNVRKVKIMEPRTMYWKKDYPDFYKVLWDRFGGNWHFTEEDRDYIRGRIKDEKSDDIKKMQDIIDKSVESKKKDALSPIIVKNLQEEKFSPITSV